MNPRPAPSRVMQFAGLAVVVASLGWLIFVVAGNRTGMRGFPDVDGSRVDVLREAATIDAFAGVFAAPAEAWSPWDGRGYIRPQGEANRLWLKVTLRHGGTKTVNAILQDTGYFPDHVSAWLEDEEGTWTRLEAGEAVPTIQNPLLARTAAFPISVPPGAERIVYLRTADYYDVYVQPRWWPNAADFFAAQLRDALAEAICYGGLAALIFYNAVLWMRLRLRETGYYVLYAGASALFNLIANGGLALFGLTLWSPWKEVVLTATLAISGTLLVQFARLFLGTKSEMPRIDRALAVWRIVLILVAAGTAMMPWAFDLFWLNLTVTMVAITHLMLLVVAVAAWRAGVSHARFFAGAFGALFVGLVPVIVTWLSHDILAWAAMCMLGSFTLEMLLLSFAVADRFARIQHERAEAQARLIEETEQRHAMQEAYADELEVEVRERTRELVEAGLDKDRMIAVIGHDLRSPLTAITGMAELLTRNESSSAEEKSRFIAEVGHIGRQVLLLIEDLVLWARLRAGTTQRTRHSLAVLLAPVVALHRAAAARRGVRLEVAEIAAGIWVSTDLVLAQTLVRNLVSNALRYAKTKVVIAATLGGGGVELTVSDDGPGLPKAVATRLASETIAPDWGGQGLGLRLCVEINRALGTVLRVEATEDGGTMFTFALEAVKAPDVSK